MKYKIVHSLPGRVRVRYNRYSLSDRQAALVKVVLESKEGITSAEVNTFSGGILIRYKGISEAQAVGYVGGLDKSVLENRELLATVAAPSANESLLGTLTWMVIRHYLKKLLPFPIRRALHFIGIAPRLVQGVKSVAGGRFFCADTLDATALGLSFFKGNINTTGSVSFLLNVGEVLEEYTKRKSFDNLALSMLNADELVSVIQDDGQEVQVSSQLLKTGDRVICRMGGVIPADGTVIDGLAMVNQASMTGESLPVEKKKGSGVFASTIVEEGEIMFRVKNAGGETRVNKIVSMIDRSQNLKAASQISAERIADSLVKYNFMLAGATYLITRDFTKAMSTLLVDYSCAMKLSAPICVLSAMRDCAKEGIIVKGGKFIEELSRADTFVFDKTGTLTESNPRVSRIIPFDGRSEDEMLKLVACLEEHFPHSLARAVVNEAKRRGITHEEEHTKVEYVLAHGIASTLNGQKLCVGSAHFIFDDEHIPMPDTLPETIDALAADGDSVLYFSEGDHLAGVIAIKDFIREESVMAVAELKKLGVKNIVMITGDGERTAAAVARQAGITEYISQALPDTKVDYIKRMRSEGHIVAMIGDGINDAPALAEANIGIAMGKASSIASETADIMLPDDGLQSLPRLKAIGSNLASRITGNNKVIIGVNSALILGGITGLVPNATAALLHNTTTVVVGMNAMREM